MDELGIDETIDLISTKPLLQLDRTIESYETVDDQPGEVKRLKKIILRCILSISGQIENAINCEDEKVEELAKRALDNNSEIQNKELVAICYLRLISSSKIDWVTLPPWRPKVFSFIDTVFRNKMYKDWKIDDRLQSHEKTLRFQEIVHLQEKSLNDALDSLTSLDRLLTNQTKLMGILNNRTGQLLFQPFLPNNLLSLLSDVYDSCRKYIDQKETPKVVNYYREALDSINRLSEQLCTDKTKYSLRILNKLSIPLTKKITEEFAENKAAQPAKLTIKPSLKKYPFHTVNKQVNLDFLLINEGPGFAYQTKIEIVTLSDSIKIISPILQIGRVSPNERYPVQIPATISQKSEIQQVIIEICWQNFDGEELRTEFSGELTAQRTNINWEGLQQTDPYSLEPVNDEKQLVGRQDVLNRLIASINSPNTGSNIIHGQKRVGKTSIAKVLQTRLIKQNILNVYLEAGDFVTPTAGATIKRLGEVLYKKLNGIDARISLLNKPIFDESFSPICDFVDEIQKILPDKKIVIIIDEFDQLPLDMYTKGMWGDSFFETLRSLSSRAFIGFIIVGGERMAHVIDNQGSRLNKWNLVPVDYFSKENDWNDYQELIQRPVENILDYSLEALQDLHELTAGNPYFTKLICQYIFRAAVKNRDCSISTNEVLQAVDQALIETKSNTFQHFWDDRIFSTGEKASEISIRRRRILIALAEILRTKPYATGKSLSEHPVLHTANFLDSDLKEFVTRKVLDGDISGFFNDQVFTYKVKFFEHWMKSHGIQDIISTFTDIDSILSETKRIEDLKVKSDEIVKLVNKWGNYKGKSISSEDIRAWIDQFTQVDEQRLMFKLLNNVRFYSNSYLREKMKEAHKMAVRSLTRNVKHGQQKRADILVSYLDSPGKSGASITRLYADEAEIYVENVIDKSKILSKLEKGDDIQAIIFLDDLVGTGHQVVENLKEIYQIIGTKAKEKNIKIIFIAVVALIDGWKYLNQQIEELDLNVETRYCEFIDEKLKYFSEESEIFSNQTERDNAKKISINYGKQLVKDNPLGYGNLGIGVVFEHGCPNDSLPILWAEKASPQWIPLFRRL